MVEYSLHIDGSGNDDNAEPTWAICIFASYSDLTVTLTGYAFGVLVHDPSD